ncbi:hypothetical protein K438DRAFT_1984616 [Mycena galopus ATCC 62051]|nr:hypothetical protein K438DRAFT_1984616 [Mycena galopus ATCC 62051]
MEQLRILDHLISEGHKLTGTDTDFLQAITLPQVLKLLYPPHNPLPYAFRALHMQNITARLEPWSTFLSCRESTSPADKSVPCVKEHARALLYFVVHFNAHMPTATLRITLPNLSYLCTS